MKSPTKGCKYCGGSCIKKGKWETTFPMQKLQKISIILSVVNYLKVKQIQGFYFVNID